MHPLLFENTSLFDPSVFSRLYISQWTVASSSVPAVVTSKLWDCQFLLWIILVMSVNVTWCSVHHLHLGSPLHWNNSLPCSISSLGFPLCLLGWCEAPPLSSSTSHSSGKISPKFVKTHIGCLMFSLTSIRQENCRIDPLVWHLEVKLEGGQ